MHNLTGSDTIFEYACSENSILGEMCESVGIEGIRLSRETIDLADGRQVSQLLEHVEQRPGADGWVGLPCTDFCPWQHMNIHRYGAQYEKKLRKRRKHGLKMFVLASEVMSKLLSQGGRVAIEWAADSRRWDLPEVQQFEKDHGFRRVYFHGCMWVVMV
jgi:hypothetical protein